MNNSGAPLSSTPWQLFRERQFLPLFVTQFLGALNDNVFKNSLIVLLTFQSGQWTSLSPALLANLAAGIFMLPFLFLSATAGQLADKLDKAWLARQVKLFELFIIGIAGVGFFLHHWVWLMLALFLLGLHSTIFGPLKYAILPQHLRADQLIAGNALIEAGTFIAILLGSLLGAMVSGLPNAGHAILLLCGLIGLGGYLAARQIPQAVAPAPDLFLARNPLTESWRNLALASKNRDVWLTILAISWFWLYGGLVLIHLPGFVRDILQGNERLVTFVLALFIIGIGAGSLLCEWLARPGRMQLPRLVGLGGVGMSFCTLVITTTVANPEVMLEGGAFIPWLSRLLWFGLGLGGGLFTVPLYTTLQRLSKTEIRGRMIAANNTMNAVFMLVGTMMAMGLFALGFDQRGVWNLLALINLAVAIYMVWSATWANHTMNAA
jgi:MFS family permease